MYRSLGQKLTRLSIMLALASAPSVLEAVAVAPHVVFAQDTWIDIDDDRPTARTRSSGPDSLDEARSSGSGLSITGDRARDIPPAHTVHTGDTLWDITDHYYGNPWEWPRVWSYNPEITNPHWIYPLDQVRLLPSDGSVPASAVGHVVARSRAEEDTVWLREQGWLDPEALRTAGEVIGSPTDHMLLSPYDEVYVHFDELEGDRDPAGEYTVFREIEASEREAGEQGTLVRILGTVRIESWDRERRTARATLIEALDPIERGFRVAAVPRRFDVVPPVRADRDLETTVVASLAPHQLLGSDQIVFVPVGETSGLVLGNRFYIVRAGDEWRRTVTAIGASTDSMGTTERSPDEPEEWPDEVIAEGRVVSLRPDSAGLFITRSTRTVEVGDRAQLREGY
jgi:hypothetical protein